VGFGLNLPMLLPVHSVNQILPSGPALMPTGSKPEVGTEYSVNDPDVVILPILLPSTSANQRLPSGPAVMP
jgi:hypothetical protein